MDGIDFDCIMGNRRSFLKTTGLISTAFAAGNLPVGAGAAEPQSGKNLRDTGDWNTHRSGCLAASLSLGAHRLGQSAVGQPRLHLA